MDKNEWVARCSARLLAQWSRILREQRYEVAVELHCDGRWKQLEPEHAAAEWLLQGIPGEGRRDAI